MTDPRNAVAIEAASSAVGILKRETGTVSGGTMIVCIAAMLALMHEGATRNLGRADADRLFTLVTGGCVEAALDIIEGMSKENA